MAMPGILHILADTARGFSRDDCPRSAAALAYSVIFALPPLLVLLLMLAGAVWDPGDVQRAMETQVGDIVGRDVAAQIHGMIAETDRPGTGGVLAVVLGLGALVFSATGAFVALQGALNRTWQVAPDPDAGGIRSLLMKRLLSVGMLLGIAFLLLASLAVSAILGLLGDLLVQLLPGAFSGPVLWALDVSVSLLMITLLFAGIFKVLPDARVAWRDVWAGAFFTALLFQLGKYALAVYFARSDPGSAFGAAGSLAVLLLWIYYASMIVLAGAEFTRAWAAHHGHDVAPERGAVRVVPQLRRAGEREGSQGAARPASAGSPDAAPERPELERPIVARRAVSRVGPDEARPVAAARASRPKRQWPRATLVASGLAAYAVLRLVHRPRRREWAAFAPDPLRSPLG